MRNRGFAALFLLLALTVTAAAVTPQFWENFTQDDLLEGDLDHMSLSSEGKLFVSRKFDMIFDTGESYIFSMVRDKKGNLYVGTGDNGKVFRIDPEGKGSLFFQAEEINIFAMDVDSSGNLYVGTSPDGKVYRVTGPNQATEYFDVKEKYIWSLVFDENDNLYIGTGGGGVVYKVSNNGDKTVFYKCADTHVMCLALNEKGNILAGTSPSGLLIEIDPEGKGFTIVDTPMEEVHSLVFDSFGGMYAIASSSSGLSVGSISETKNVAVASGLVSTVTVLTESSLGIRKVENENATIRVPGNGKTPSGTVAAVYLISKDRSIETIYSSKKQMIFDSVLSSDGSILLATSPKGRLLSINTRKQVSVLSDTSEEHLTRLLVDGDAVYAGGSNQGKVFKLQPDRASSGVFESRILDARKVASWGKIFWNVINPQGAFFELFTRTGNTEKIGNSWSDWSDAYTETGQQVTSPNARYLQWRVAVKQNSSSLKEPLSDILDNVRIAYLQKNLRPQITKIEVLPYGIELQKQPALSVGSASLVAQAKTPDGRSFNAPRERGKNNPNLAPRQVLQPGAQSFTWDATDENQDSLEYSIYFRGESETDWKLLEKKYFDTFYTAYAATLPDGTYRLKVVASDAPSNPSNAYMIGELVSRPFIIANTPPRLEIEGREVQKKKVAINFRACVAAGNITTSEFSVDGGGWHLLFPIDGIADSDCEEYRFATSDLSVGEHLISIRSSDRYGNTGISKEIVRIP